MTLEKFRNRYRIASIRAQWWNYADSAGYFVTICTKNREPFFGEIQNSAVRLSEIGEIVKREWLATPGIRPDMNLSLGEYAIMPDHFHGIIIIGPNQYNRPRIHRRDAMHRVSTDGATDRSPTDRARGSHCFGPQRKNLASIMRGFKSAVTIRARLICREFAWQERYYDHVIRNEKAFARISRYIRFNPENWELARFLEYLKGCDAAIDCFLSPD